MQRSIHIKGRLLEIANLVTDSDIIADIGCDHGRLCAYLLQKGRVKLAYASDISEPSLLKAKQLCQRCDLDDKMQFVVADGLSGLPQAVDTIIIAGMGGELIADILEAGNDYAMSTKNIIMQPMRGVYELRKYLHDKGYVITDDVLSRENGRTYQIIKAHYCGGVVDNSLLPVDFFEFGEQMLGGDEQVLCEYLTILKKEYTDALECARKGNITLSDIEYKLKVIDSILSERSQL